MAPEKLRDSPVGIGARRLIQYLLVMALLISITIVIDIVAADVWYGDQALTLEIWSWMFLIDAGFWILLGILPFFESLRAPFYDRSFDGQVIYEREDPRQWHRIGSIVMLFVGSFFFVSCLATWFVSIS